jgi:hypothetical protein
MTTKRAPAVATWLLKHFGCGPNIDAVLGDLAEQYLHKSRMWYWRQVLKGIPVSIVKEALGHKSIAAKGIVAGCITWLIFLTIYPNFVFGFAGGPVLTFDIFGAAPLIGAWAALSSPVATSLILPNDWTVFRIWIQFALPLIAWTVCGWVVTRVDIGRTHRDLAPVFAGFVLLLNLVVGIPGLIWFLNKLSRYTFGPDNVPFSTLAPGLIALTVAHAAVAVFGILLGGSLRRTKGEATR